MKPNLQKTLLALCCADLMLLAACSGGGGSGMVRSDVVQATAPPPPPPPPAAPAEPCPAPVTSDCVVTTAAEMLGGRSSQHRLIVHSGRQLTLGNDDPSFDQARGRATYTFNGGTVVEDSTLYVRQFNTLTSDVQVNGALALLLIGGTVQGRIDNRGTTQIWGTVHGNVGNHGTVELGGTVHGDVANHGVLRVASTIYPDSAPISLIDGNFRNATSGTLSAAIPLGTAFVGRLQVTGRADIDGGTLQLYQYSDAWGPYALPTAPLSAHILHADGGVFGQFAQWTSPGLFVEGRVRYGSHDVWFDLTRISLQSAMAANAAADPMTLATAANIDAALSSADGFALAEGASLEAVQRRFLASASALLYARDVAQASRTLDSLSGHAHVLAQDLLHEQPAAALAQLDARLDRLPRGLQSGLWATSLSQDALRGGGNGSASGYDQWLGPRWLVGGSVARLQSQVQFERMGGHGRTDSPLASVHAHYRGDDWHATGVVGAGRSTLQMERTLDLGAAGAHRAQSRRRIDQAFLHGELGRRIALGHGLLTPFAALDYSAVRSDGFTEQGDTGFELAAQAARSTQLSAAVGTRYARDWNLARGWLGLRVDARYQQRLAVAGDAQQAAFVGTPEVLFELPAWAQEAGFGTLHAGVAGGFDDRWRWSLDYAHRFGGGSPQGGWFAGLRRDF